MRDAKAGFPDRSPRADGSFRLYNNVGDTYDYEMGTHTSRYSVIRYFEDHELWRA